MVRGMYAYVFILAVLFYVGVKAIADGPGNVAENSNTGVSF